jgi:hypothetical protein
MLMVLDGAYANDRDLGRAGDLRVGDGGFGLVRELA